MVLTDGKTCPGVTSGGGFKPQRSAPLLLSLSSAQTRHSITRLFYRIFLPNLYHVTDAKKKEKTYNTQNKTKRLCFGRGNFQCVVLFSCYSVAGGERPERKIYEMRNEGKQNVTGRLGRGSCRVRFPKACKAGRLYVFSNLI